VDHHVPERVKPWRDNQEALDAGSVAVLRCKTRSSRAHSSAGQSYRLITGRSLVRIQVGPRRADSSVGRAPASQAGGRRFKPCSAHHVRIELVRGVKLEALGPEYADWSALVREQANCLGSGALTHIEIGNRSIGYLDV
jgi:hypothetical protein